VSIINLTSAEKKRVRGIILLQPRPARIHRKALILYQLSRWNDINEIARYYRLKPEAITKVLDEFRSKGLEGTIAVRDETEEHRKRLEEVEKRAPSREKFQAMRERFPAPDQWLDDEDDWDL
jgi:hypothetical protein